MGADSAAAAREQFMLRAIKLAGRCMAAGGPPVGACLVRHGELIAEAGNAVVAELDVTAHAEIQLLRHACREQRTLDLSGCELYVTVEPCLMCFSASAYAGIETIFYGAPIASMAAVTGSEIAVPPDAFSAATQSPVLRGGLLADECEQLLVEWNRSLEARPR